MEISEIDHLRGGGEGYHALVKAIAFGKMVEGTEHMLTKLEQPIKKVASQYIILNSKNGTITHFLGFIP